MTSIVLGNFFLLVNILDLSTNPMIVSVSETYYTEASFCEGWVKAKKLTGEPFSLKGLEVNVYVDKAPDIREIVCQITPPAVREVAHP